jgi:hypothetical protein
MGIFRRRPDPPAYSDYRRYKPLLREDFEHRCAYCLLHEGGEIGGGFQNFHIDHFRPRSKFGDLISIYSNLYYACRWCNGAKSETWPSTQEEQLGFGFVDPCVEDLYAKHARLDPSTGRLEPTSKPGKYTIREIQLNRRKFNELRKSRIEAEEIIQSTQARISRLERERNPKTELISVLKEKVALLAEKYINPKVPYELDDLLVEK